MNLSRTIEACDKPPETALASAAERVRARELAKYFSSASIVSSGSKESPILPPSLPKDSTLSALAQLGALKLNCNRSFISLIDRTHQYIIGEATKSISLTVDGQNAADDGLYLGVQALDINFGVCPQTIHVFSTGENAIDTTNTTANRGRYVIRDFCAELRFKDRPYVVGWPHMRSYAEVPLTSPNGFVIGSYCVVDDKSRDFNDNAVFVLDEIASTIMNHLELLKIKLEYDRADRLMRGLGSYIEGDLGSEHYINHRPKNDFAVLEGADTRAEGNSRPPSVRTRPSMNSAPPLEISSAVAETKGKPTGFDSTSPGLQEVFADSNSTGEAIEQASSQAGEYAEEGIVLQRSLISMDVRTAFSRAANVIRGAMDMQGVVFLDACTSSFGSLTRAPGGAYTSHSSLQPGTKGKRPMCARMGYSIEQGDRADTAVLSDERHNVSEDLLQRMLTMYPFGHVFSSDELGVLATFGTDGEQKPDGHPSRSGLYSAQDVGSWNETNDFPSLFEGFDRARSILFLPLWDFQKQRWLAGTIAWTTNPARVFDVNDMTYLSAFGNSIIAEMSKIEAKAVSRAKSDFISNISHELRSPLHGSLAGAELLRESMPNVSEASTIDIIETCGNMLLDTMNHLLDFAKINSLTKSKSTTLPTRAEEASGQGRMNLVSVTDLSVLVQDIVEGVYLGHTARQAMQEDITNDAATTTTDRNRHTAAQTIPKATHVLVDVQPGVNWRIETEAGAWKRIIMNLFGNAMKYTAEGIVEVVLRFVDLRRDSVSGVRSVKHVCLEVNDTGQGMSATYLKERLFTPFAQENSLSVGTGLGLSIVHQLVTGLEGSIDIQSELGIGTRISVMIPIGNKAIEVPTEPSISTRMAMYRLDPEARLSGKTLCLHTIDASGDLTEPSSELLSVEARLLLATRALLTKVAQEWLGMSLQDLALKATSDSQHLLRRPILALFERPVGHEDINSTLRAVTTHVRYPLAPRKLAIALLGAFESDQALSSSAARSDSGLDIERKGSREHEAHQQPLPAYDVETNGDRKRANQKPPIESTLGQAHRSPNVLLVDDNAINLKILTTCVKKLGCTYIQASNGLEAVSAYKASKKPFDIVFMDLSMPVMDGCSATREIRAYELSMKQSPTRIVALTGLGSADSKQEAFASGVNLFLTKPVPMKDVSALLKNYQT